MAEQANTQQNAAPQAQGGIDLDKLGTIVAGAVATAVNAALKPIGEQIAALKPAEPARKADEPKPLALADVEALLEKKLGAAQQSQQLLAQRDQYVAAKLGDVKTALPELIKLGDDPAKWPAEEQAIRGVFQERLKALGATVKTVDGGAGTAGTAKAASGVDLSKLSGQQLIAQGLKDSKPIGPAAAATAAAQQPAAAAAK